MRFFERLRGDKVFYRRFVVRVVEDLILAIGTVAALMIVCILFGLAFKFMGVD